MKFDSVKYNKFGNAYLAVLDGQKLVIPLDPANRHYAEIMRQVEAGELTIEPAE